LPAGAVQAAVAVVQFLGQLAVEMPGAIATVQLPSHFPDFHVNSAIPVIIPFYATFRHVRKLTLLPAALLSGVGTGWFNLLFGLRESSRKAGRLIQ